MTPRAILSLATVGLTALIVPPVVFAPLHAAAPNDDFDAVVSALEQRYSVHAERVPMMGFVSFSARAASAGGVKNMRVAEFDHISPLADTPELEHLLSASLGDDWQHFVTERETNGAFSLIFVRPDGAAMRMLIADYEDGELDVVRMELNGDRLRRWMREPGERPFH